MLRRPFGLEPLEGRSLLSGTDIGFGFDGDATATSWIAPTASVAPVAESASDFVLSPAPQRFVTAAMRGRVTLSPSFDVSAIDSFSFGAVSFVTSPLNSSALIGIAGSEQNSFTWPAFTGRFSNVMVSTPGGAKSFVASSVVVESTSDGMFCVSFCSATEGENGTSFNFNRFLTTTLDTSAIAQINSAFELSPVRGPGSLRLHPLGGLGDKPQHAWSIGRGEGDAFDSIDVIPGEIRFQIGEGKLIAGREPIHVWPGDGGNESGDGSIGENTGFIGLANTADFNASVSGAFTRAAEGAANADVFSYAPNMPMESMAGDEGVKSGVSQNMNLTPDLQFGEATIESPTVAMPGAGVYDVDVPDAISPGSLGLAESDVRGTSKNDRSIVRSEPKTADVLPDSTAEAAPAVDGNHTDLQAKTDDVRSDVLVEDSQVDATTADAIAEAVAEAMAAAEENGGGLIALDAPKMPNDSMMAASAAEPWFVEDARTTALASADDVRFESNVGLFQVFDVAAVLPVVNASGDKLEAEPKPTFAVASLFASITNLGADDETQQPKKADDNSEPRIEEATVGSELAIAAASAIALSAGLSLRRKGPVAKIRAIFERWPWRNRSRRS
jgi:hypothetical protein